MATLTWVLHLMTVIMIKPSFASFCFFFHGFLHKCHCKKKKKSDLQNRNIMCFLAFRLSSSHSQCFYPWAEPEPEVVGPTVVIKKSTVTLRHTHHSSSELLQIRFYWLKMYIGYKIMLYSCSYYTMFSVCLHLNFMSVVPIQDKDNSCTEREKKNLKSWGDNYFHKFLTWEILKP